MVQVRNISYYMLGLANDRFSSICFTMQFEIQKFKHKSKSCVSVTTDAQPEMLHVNNDKGF